MQYVGVFSSGDTADCGLQPGAEWFIDCQW